MPGIVEWILREEHTLGAWFLKHAILIELAMIKLQIVLGYLILRSKTIPIEWLIIGGIIISVVVRTVLKWASRRRFF